MNEAPGWGTPWSRLWREGSEEMRVQEVYWAVLLESTPVEGMGRRQD